MKNYCQSLLSPYLFHKNTGWHAVYSRVQKLSERNKYAPNDLLVYMYEHTLCSYCRERTVKEMRKRKILSYKMIEECRYDCNGDIQNYVERYCK